MKIVNLYNNFYLIYRASHVEIWQGARFVGPASFDVADKLIKDFEKGKSYAEKIREQSTLGKEL